MTARRAVAVVLLALVVRVGYVAWVGFDLKASDLQGDDVDYYGIAVNIVGGDGVSRTWMGAGPDNGKIVPTAYRTPLWPLVEAAAFKVAHPSPVIARWLTVLLDAAASLLVFWLGCRLRGPTVGFAAGLVAAVYPPMWIYVSALYSEPLMAVTVVLALIAAEGFHRRPGPAAGALLGGALGLVALARPNGIVVAILLIAWAVWIGRDDLRRAAVNATAVTVMTLAVVAPWVAYASARLHEFVPMTTQSGVLLAGDFNDAVADTGDPRWGYWNYELIIRRLFESDSEDEWNHSLFDEGRRWIADNPGDAVKVVVLRTVRYFDLYASPDNRARIGIPTTYRTLNIAVVGAWWFVFGLAIAGTVRLWRRRELGPWAPALLVFASLAVSGMLLGGATRYRAPAEPVVVLLAATYVVSRVSERSPAAARRGCGPTPVAP